MHRPNVISLLLAGSGLLAGLALAVENPDESELAMRIKNHINERMYETCKSVVLKHEADAVYRGYAEFLNGVKVDLEVTVSGTAIDYQFLKRPKSPSPSAQTRLAELEALAVQQEAEIVRLQELCLRAGIEVNPPPPETTFPLPEDPNDVAADQVQNTAATTYKNQGIVAPESPRFTWKIYESIEKGMSYAAVVEVLGDEGHLISSSYFDNAQNEIVVWTNPDDSHVCVVFRNGTVLVKTQFGLPETLTMPPN